jgi:hypothetical protein
MTTIRSLSHLLAGSLLISLGCVGSADSTTSGNHGGGGKGDQISPNDDPNQLFDGASFRLADNITADDVGKTFGTDDGHIPYPDTYWPFTSEGIDSKWNGSDPSPLEKYMSIVNAAGVADAKMWEHNNHGNGVPGVAGWWGHCPGWTGAAMSNAPLQHAVYAASDGNGGIVPCNAGDMGCVKFEIGDINALEAEVYVDADSHFIGARCDTKPSDIKRDQYGRIVRSGAGCQGLNAGALLVVAGNLMKGRQKAFAIDAQNDFNTDQIWNQPSYRYTVYRYETLTEAQAANLVAYGKKDGDLTKYMWNDAAHGFVFVDFGIKWVGENGPNTAPVSGADSTRETRMVAVIELDGDPTANPSIIGGEYLDDSSVGADRLRVPPFVWVALDAGPEQPSSWGGHNPFVKSSLVKQLVAMGQN